MKYKSVAPKNLLVDLGRIDLARVDLVRVDFERVNLERLNQKYDNANIIHSFTIV